MREHRPSLATIPVASWVISVMGLSAYICYEKNNKHGDAEHGDQPTQRAGLSVVVRELLEIF